MENNMSNDWPYDINKMHEHYKIYNAISKLTEDKEKLHALLQFRISFLNEELNDDSLNKLWKKTQKQLEEKLSNMI